MADVDPETLRRVTVFSTCTAAQLAHLAEAAEMVDHAEGEALTEEGAIGHRFHLFLKGSARVLRDGQQVGTVATGEFVGETGLLGGGPSTATVRCDSPVSCLELRRERFWQLLEEQPAIALRILEVVCRRIEQTARPGPTANLGPA